MDKKKHRHVWVLRILPRQYGDNHEGRYTGFLRIFYYDPTTRETFLEFHDIDDIESTDPYRIGKDDYLFSEFTHRDTHTGEAITQDYTLAKRYHLPPEKEYDPPEGIRLCAEINLDAYGNAFEAWNRYQDLSKIPPVSARAIGIMKHYERVVADCRQWYFESCPEYLPKISLESISTSAKMPDQTSLKALSQKKAEIPRPARWSDLTITFTSQDAIRINVVGHRAVRRNFSELGFADNRKRDMPNVVWSLLKILVVVVGTIELGGPSLGFRTRRSTEQQLMRLRKKLKELFHLETNPIPFSRRKRSYHCLFNLRAEDHIRKLLNDRYSF